MEKYPLDFSTLSKGDVVTTEQIEGIYLMSRGDSRFSLKVLALRNQIELERSDLVTCSVKQSIRILTDREADAYLEHQTDQNVNRMMRTASKTLRVDTSEFTDGERRLSDSRSRRSTMVAMVAVKAQRDCRRELNEARNLLVEEGELESA